MVRSPLNNSTDVTMLRVIKTETIINEWYKKYRIDIKKEMQGKEEIALYLCNQTNLKFFFPPIAGSNEFYEQLQQYDWYYPPKKWEHDMAMKDIADCQRVLEVGCGKGSFVDRVRKEKSIEVKGIELNDSAVKCAQKDDIPVYKKNIQELATEEEGVFDAVCSFQVLEHITDILPFVEDMIKLLKENGKLILSVPNASSFIRYEENNLLDQPPHHVTQWCEDTFLVLADILPVQIKHFKIEPLAKYHINWYVSCQFSRLPKNKGFDLLKRIGSIFFRSILCFRPIRSLIQGHTLYVCLEKCTNK
jgi:SAM-dependent methyltransferase